MAKGRGPNRVGIQTAEMSAALGRLRAAAPGVRRRALRGAAIELTGAAQIDSPVRYGTLQDSHTHDLSNPDAPRIGANTTYAAAVHERHPTKSRWFLASVIGNGPRVMKAALEEAMGWAAKQANKPGKGGR